MPDTLPLRHLKPNCHGGGCAFNVGATLNPWDPLQNVPADSLKFKTVKDEAALALGTRFAPEVVLRVRCGLERQHDVEFVYNNKGDDLVLERTDANDIQSDCPEVLFVWDYTVAECINLGVSAFEHSHQHAVRFTEKVARDEASWSNYHPSDSDKDEQSSSEDLSDNIDKNSSLSSESSSEDSNEESPRKRRRTYAAMRPPGRPKRPDELNVAPSNLPDGLVKEGRTIEYFEEMEDRNLREYINLTCLN
ncbi:hypothetical protein PQX77_017178 [Marasmius sp. AFHP31]|nr:hypothetical protein PQX77_017178 [Marasmius sp. AFHP31]